MNYKGKLEYAHTRKLRIRNKQHYRFAHWPIWIAVFFLAPGASTFALIDHGLGSWNGAWLLFVMMATAVAGWSGKLPGMEREPYILRFDEHRQNPVYRRVCYTAAWNAVLSFAILNLLGLLVADATGHGYLQQIYRYGYPPLCALIMLLGVAGMLPRAGVSTKSEGLERRYFYGAVWTVTVAQILLLVVWKVDFPTEIANHAKLFVFVAALLIGGLAAVRGALPRTRPILPGELIIRD